jgi:hypothetical protein
MSQRTYIGAESLDYVGYRINPALSSLPWSKAYAGSW